MGGRKLYDLLNETIKTTGIKMGRDALFDLLAHKGLLIRKPRRSVRTTFSQHRFRKYPTLIKELVIDRPNQGWVSDITYWFTHYGCLYISLVTDAYSRRIMGYGVAPTLQAVHCKAALQMALEHIDLKTGPSLIHHRSGAPVRPGHPVLQCRARHPTGRLSDPDQYNRERRPAGKCDCRTSQRHHQK